MQYHDYQLDSYKVSDCGETIEFNLVYGYPSGETDHSQISFSGVALYHFVNTHGAIITDISEVPLVGFILSIQKELVEWQRMYGLRYWQSDVTDYIERLKSKNQRVWEISSAIGFYGFVIAEEVNAKTW